MEKLALGITLLVILPGICLMIIVPSCDQKPSTYASRQLEVKLAMVKDSIALEMARDTLIILRELRIERDKKKYGPLHP